MTVIINHTDGRPRTGKQAPQCVALYFIHDKMLTSISLPNLSFAVPSSHCGTPLTQGAQLRGAIISQIQQCITKL